MKRARLRARRVRHPWYARRGFWILLAFVVLALAAFRWALDPLADYAVRRAIDSMEGFSGSLDRVAVDASDMRIVVHGLMLERIPPSGQIEPPLQVERVELDVLGSQLWRGRLAARVRIIEPRFVVIRPGGVPIDPARVPAQVPDIASAIADATPFHVERVEIRDGVIVVVDAGEPGRPEIRVSGIQATIEGLRSGKPEEKRKPTVFAARAKLQESGDISLFLTADLLAPSLTFAGQVKMTGLELVELNPLIKAKTGAQIAAGEFDVFVSFMANGGKISGNIKPLLKNVEIEPWNDDLLTQLMTGLADLTVKLFSDRVPDREAVAAIIPFTGEVTAPQPFLVPTIASIVRNAFVVGLASGFANLSPDRVARVVGS